MKDTALNGLCFFVVFFGPYVGRMIKWLKWTLVPNRGTLRGIVH